MSLPVGRGVPSPTIITITGMFLFCLNPLYRMVHAMVVVHAVLCGMSGRGHPDLREIVIYAVLYGVGLCE